MFLGRSRAEREVGAIAVLVAILMVVIIAMAAVVVDLGMTFSQRRVAQKAADLAALAAGQDLPASTTSARARAAQTAAAFLGDNGYSGVTAGQLTDLNRSNGEIYFSGDAAFDAMSGCASVGVCVEVVAPTTKITYLFSPAMGALLNTSSPDTGNVSASATVQVRSIGAVLPFVFTDLVGPGVNCVKNKPVDSICNITTEGNFGYAELPSDSGSTGTAALINNLKYGAKYSPAVINNATVVYNALTLHSAVGAECVAAGDPEGAILPAPINGYTCLTTETGGKQAAIANAWISSNNKACDGRLVDGSVSAKKCTLLPDKLSDYQITDADGNVVVDPSVESDPRFGIIPVVATNALTNGTKTWAIVKFYGIYIRNLYDKNNQYAPGEQSALNNQIDSFDAYVFELPEGIQSNSGEVTTDYTGGVKVPVLVR